MSLLLLHGRENGLVRAGLEAFYDFRKTNLLRYSEQFNNAAWGTGPVTPDVSTSPQGDLTADLLSDASDAGAEQFSQLVPIASSSDSYTFSVFVKKDEDETRFPEFRVQATGGTVEPLTSGQLNTKTGAFQKTSGSGSMTVTSERTTAQATLNSIARSCRPSPMSWETSRTSRSRAASPFGARNSTAAQVLWPMRRLRAIKRLRTAAARVTTAPWGQPPPRSRTTPSGAPGVCISMASTTTF
jgi:hypothetical protein